MTANGGSPTKRVELDDDGWAEVRRVNGAILRQMRLKRHERGYDDDTQDTLDVLPDLIAEWHKGEKMTPADVDGLDEMSITRIWLAAKGIDLPNQSAPSSAGGVTKTRGRRRSSGSSV